MSEAVEEWETYIEEAIASTAEREDLVASLRLVIRENRLPNPAVRCESCGGTGDLPREWGPPSSCGACLGSGVRR